MNAEIKKQLLAQSWQMHSAVEQAYLAHAATINDPEWAEKQRLLLADMALHLLQTALNSTEIELDKLRNNLHAILTISDAFLPDAALKAATDKLY